MLPVQRAVVQSLVRDLDPTCHSQDPAQPNKQILNIFFKNKEEEGREMERELVEGGILTSYVLGK